MGGAFDTAKTEFEKAGDLSKEFQSQAARRGRRLCPRGATRPRSQATPRRTKSWRWPTTPTSCSGPAKRPRPRSNSKSCASWRSQADLDMPIFRRLAPIARELGSARRLAGRRSRSAADFGQRPPLDSLGPLRWQPAPAESWTLPNRRGRAGHLSDYRGKPVMVVFYLGFGCVHCVEQLRAITADDGRVRRRRGSRSWRSAPRRPRC